MPHILTAVEAYTTLGEISDTLRSCVWRATRRAALLSMWRWQATVGLALSHDRAWRPFSDSRVVCTERFLVKVSPALFWNWER